MKGILRLGLTTIGGSIGWALGHALSLYMAFILSFVGSGVGLYYSIKITRALLP